MVPDTIYRGYPLGALSRISPGGYPVPGGERNRESQTATSGERLISTTIMSVLGVRVSFVVRILIGNPSRR